MRRILISILFVVWGATLYGQTMNFPATGATTASVAATFKWYQTGSTIAAGFEIMYSTTSGDLTATSAAPINLGTMNTGASAVKGYVSYSASYSATAPLTSNLYTKVLTPVLSENTTYYWKVRQKVGTTWGVWTVTAFSFKTGTPSISAPAALSTIAPGAINVSWTNYGYAVTEIRLKTGDFSGWSTTSAATVATTSTASAATLTFTPSASMTIAKVGFFASSSATVPLFSSTGAFTINPKTITVIDLKGAASNVVPAGVSNVTWTNYHATPVSIKLTLNGSAGTPTWVEIPVASSLVFEESGAGTAACTFPTYETNQTDCKVGFFEAGDVLLASSAAFTLSGKKISVLTPSNTVVPGSSTVTWTNSNVALESFNLKVNGVLVSTPAVTVASAATSGTFNFPVYQTDQGNCSFVFYESGAATVTFITSPAFTLEARYITVTSPTGSVGAGSSTVNWTNKNVSLESFNLKVAGVLVSTPAVTVLSNATSGTFNFPVYDADQGNCSFVFYESGAATVQFISSSAFTLSAKKVTVIYPALNNVVPYDSQTVSWQNNNATLLQIKLSIDGGSTYLASTATPIAEANRTGDKTMKFFFPGGRTARTNCKIGFFDATSDANTPFQASAAFTIAVGAVSISIGQQYGDPGAAIASMVPVVIQNKLYSYANDAFTQSSVRAYTVKLKYNKDYITLPADEVDDVHVYSGTAAVTTASGWTMMQKKDESTGGEGLANVILSGYAAGTTDGLSTFNLGVNFSVTAAATPGNSTGITFATDSYFVADENAQNISSYITSSAASDDLKILTYITGNVKYLYQLATPSTLQYNIVNTGNSNFITYTDFTQGVGELGINSKSANTDASGNYAIRRIVAGNNMTYYPSSELHSADVEGKITSTEGLTAEDARLAFTAAFSSTLTNRQCLAADVNEDGAVNVLDAIAIMDIIGDAATWYNNMTPTKKPWIFVTIASVEDHEVGTYGAPMRLLFEESFAGTLTTGMVHTGKDFMGVVRGDANLSMYANASGTTISLEKISADAVICSVPENIQAKPGDIVSIPVSLSMKQKDIGAYTAYIQFDKEMFSSIAGYEVGSIIPKEKGWYTVANYNPKTGRAVIATTDLAGEIDPITADGIIVTLKMKLSDNAKRGMVTPVTISTVNLSDSKLSKLSFTKSDGTIEITRMGAAVIKDYELSQNYPNPFNPSTTIEYALPKESRVEIEIYNLLGQRVASLFTGTQSTGYHQVDWNASNLGSGVYFYTLKATSTTDGQDFRAVKKLMLLK